MVYDPVKAHEYYERTKQLKGRQKGTKPPPRGPTGGKLQSTAKKKPTSDQIAAKKARVERLRKSVAKLQKALIEAQSALREKQASSRQTAKKETKENSDGKATAEEKQNSKEYRDKHKQEINAKRRKESDKDSGGGGGSKSSSSTSVSDMGVDELKSRVSRIKSTLSEAKRQLSNAQNQLGQLAHSAIVADPEFNAHFAQLRREEGIPSQ